LCQSLTLGNSCHVVLQGGAGDSFEVVHLQYIGWPDFDVPTDVSVILRMMQITEAHASTDEPVVVHCSAGVGRSGSFITVHVALCRLREALKTGKNIDQAFDIPGIVVAVRNFRVMMVQKREQYVFCHAAVATGAANLLSSGNFT
jgi:protein-tyrosine phosphatase